MITFTLVAVAALAALAVIWVAATWFIQREPAGHGKHGGRINWDDTPSPRAHLAPRLSIDVLPCMRDGYYPGAPLEPLPPMNLPGRDTQESDGLGDHPAGEPHHRDWTPRPLSAVRDGLAQWVEAALANATINDTVIDADHGTFTRWLENVMGGDPWDGLGSQDAYLERVCPPVRAIAAGGGR